MSSKTLIITQSGDAHAYAVAAALRLKGAEVNLWHAGDFPSVSTATVSLIGGIKRVSVIGPEGRLVDASSPGFGSVWRRRPGFIVPHQELHPADLKFAESECAFFQRGFLDAIAPDAFWVNPVQAALGAASKISQHAAAIEVGLSTPDTLYGNDPGEIRAFLREYPGRVIYKPFRGIAWRNSGRVHASYTAVLDESDLIDDDTLCLTPGIFQALVSKAYELRITVMGSQAFSVKIYSQSTTKGRLDWRQAYDELTMERHDLPESLSQCCLALMRRLGLVFGCFDFVVTESGDPVFLEVNEMGQFLFLERYVPELPLLDAFSDFLIQGSPEFAWIPSSRVVRYEDVAAKVNEEAESASRLHVAPPDEDVWEGE